MHNARNAHCMTASSSGLHDVVNVVVVFVVVFVVVVDVVHSQHNDLMQASWVIK